MGEMGSELSNGNCVLNFITVLWVSVDNSNVSGLVIDVIDYFIGWCQVGD